MQKRNSGARSAPVFCDFGPPFFAKTLINPCKNVVSAREARRILWVFLHPLKGSMTSKNHKILARFDSPGPEKFFLQSAGLIVENFC